MSDSRVRVGEMILIDQKLEGTVDFSFSDFWTKTLESLYRDVLVLKATISHNSPILLLCFFLLTAIKCLIFRLPGMFMPLKGRRISLT